MAPPHNESSFLSTLYFCINFFVFILSFVFPDEKVEEVVIEHTHNVEVRCCSYLNVTSFFLQV